MKFIEVCNNELDTLVAVAYTDAEKYNKACNILEEIAGRTEDESVIEAMDVLCDSAQQILENDFEFGNPFADVVSEQPYIRNAPKIGRNDPCICGSGKKYKKCCGR